jgi:hypothetical protein
MKERTHTRRIATQLKLRPLEIRKIQRVFSIALLIAIALVISSSFWSEVRFASSNEQGASRLIIVLERVHVGVDDSKEITIRAVDKGGVIDRSRNDLLQLNLTSLSRGNTLTRLNLYEVRLENGSANVFLTGPISDLVKVTVTWKEGKSKLESGEALIQVGSFEGT